MVNSFIARKDLDSEMTVVRNEFERGENDPSRILFQRVMSTAFSWHNYGKSTIGSRADLENVPIERLQAFYRKYYQPDNAMLVIAGAFEPQKALAEVQKTFGRLRKPAEPLPATYTEEPTQDGERLVTLRRVGDVSALAAVYHVPEGAHPDFAAIDVLTAHPRQRPLRPPLQGPRGDEEGLQRRRLQLPAPRPRRPRLLRRGPRGPVPRHRPRHPPENGGGGRPHALHPGRGGPRQDGPAQVRGAHAQRLGERRHPALRVGRHRRLAPVLPPPRPD